MPVRWGLLGCGDIVRKRVAQAILDDPNSRLLAACRRDPEQLRAFCQTFGVAHACTTDADLLANPEVDAVYIATPVHLHFPQTLAAAAAGKHVLVEKPMARSVAECDRMIEACRRAGVLLGVAYYRRFYPIVRRVKQALAAGEIGQPLAAGAVTSTSLLAPGKEGSWRMVLAEGGGGALMDIGSHRLNLFLDLFGKPADVQACCDVLLGDHEAEDFATLLLHFDSGLHATLHCLFGTEVTADDFWVVGTRGRLVASPLNGDQLVVETAQGQRIETHSPPANLHGPLVADFTASVLAGREPTVTGEEGRAANAVMELAYRAAGATRG